MVISGDFRTSEYQEKKIYEPKERVIYKLPFSPDRIVQHAVMNVLKPILLPKMMENSFACIEKRGQLKASIRCSEYVRKYRYCLKCDIRKFYPSINQYILSGMLHKIIRDDRFMEVVDDIIFSFPGGYNCPIGNYCSQWFGNFYLTALDNFVLHELKCGAYERYCDDFLLFSNSKVYLRECRRQIEAFLGENLELKYSKADIFDVKQGVDFVGYRHFGGYVLVRKSTAKRMKKRIGGIESKLERGEITKEKALGQASSANGILKHACAWHLRQAIKLDEVTENIKNDVKEEW